MTGLTTDTALRARVAFLEAQNEALTATNTVLRGMLDETHRHVRALEAKLSPPSKPNPFCHILKAWQPGIFGWY